MITKADRIVGALRGAFVADAASMGTHWIYNPDEMAAAVPSIAAPEFTTPPTPRYYSATEFPGHYGPGQLSPYGEQLLFVTQYVAEHDDLDGPTMSGSLAVWAKTFGGRPDHALTTVLTNIDEAGKVWPECGADDSQAHIYMKIVPVVCKFAGRTDLPEKVKTAILTHQNNPMAIRFGIAAARILEAVLLGAPSLAEALATVESNLVQDLGDAAKEVQAAIDIAKAAAATSQSLSEVLAELSHEMMKDQPDSPFYDLAARSCALPGSFIAPLVQLYRTPPVDYVAGLRENILASGDTCSRAVFLGAVLGAMAPPQEDGVPVSWLDRLDAKVRSQVDGLSQKISAAS